MGREFGRSGLILIAELVGRRRKSFRRRVEDVGERVDDGDTGLRVSLSNVLLISGDSLTDGSKTRSNHSHLPARVLQSRRQQ
jgi:hypothetical protein